MGNNRSSPDKSNNCNQTTSVSTFFGDPICPQYKVLQSHMLLITVLPATEIRAVYLEFRWWCADTDRPRQLVRNRKNT